MCDRLPASFEGWGMSVFIIYIVMVLVMTGIDIGLTKTNTFAGSLFIGILWPIVLPIIIGASIAKVLK